MKRITLIGDSIRMGYQTTVQAALPNPVWAPQENGGDSGNVLLHLAEWVLNDPPDLLYLNCGLHDLKKPFDQQARQIPLADYRTNVEKILTTIQAQTETRIIWATTTPVNEAWHQASKPFARYEADVTAYNQTARDICSRLAIPVSDLFQVIMTAGRDRLLVDDGVHFSEEGYRLLGQAVVAALQPYL